MKSDILTTFIIEHKGFLFRYIRWAAPASLLVVFGVVIAVLDIQPAVRTVANAVVESDIPQKVQDTFDNVVRPNAKAPADLSSSQWAEVHEFLALGPKPFNNLEMVSQDAKRRLDITLKYGDFVFAHYGQLPEQVKGAWELLKTCSIGRPVPDGRDVEEEQQRFISKTLTVEDIITMLKQQQAYEEIRMQVNKSSTLIDRIMPALISLGLKDDITAGPQESSPGVGPNLQDFLDRHYSSATLPPAPIPPFSFTSDQIMQQLGHHPLSQDPTPAERAVK
jgi:hypothetical protein